MIVGKGDIGTILQDREGALFFASGVSNSQETSKYQFEREIKLFSQQPTDVCVFYFSTLSIYFKNSPYVQHKKHMEQLIRDRYENYNIIRIGNITFGDNPNTFINYFRRMIAQDKPYKVLDEYRYLIDKDELLLLTNNLPLTGRNEINVTGRIVKVQEVVNELLNGKKSVHQVHG
jgi:hypothetical protein